MTTQTTATLLDPDGNEVEIDLLVKWGAFERNPMDKEPSRYGGEDDGREILSVEWLP